MTHSTTGDSCLKSGVPYFVISMFSGLECNIIEIVLMCSVDKYQNVLRRKKTQTKDLFHIFQRFSHTETADVERFITNSVIVQGSTGWPKTTVAMEMVHGRNILV